MALKLGQDSGQTGKHGLVSLETLYAKILILSQLYGTHPTTVWHLQQTIYLMVKTLS